MSVASWRMAMAVILLATAAPVAEEGKASSLDASRENAPLPPRDERGWRQPRIRLMMSSAGTQLAHTQTGEFVLQTSELAIPPDFVLKFSRILGCAFCSSRVE